ncbi:MAG: YebC/PmpR family DNA-binding transcriptional regulator [Rivularia sp. (in: cyanobacteria)]
MAGHSKWANIKRQKARVDAKRGKTFTQLSRAIIVAARNGVADPNGNFQLRTAIEKAKAAGIPSDNIERAIAKGAGTFDDDDAKLEEIRYEGYGPGGVAILIEALTDNRNRTVAYLREAFTKNGGNLGETGCVSWMFSQKGVCTVKDVPNEEKLLEASLEGGAEFYEMTDDDMAEVVAEVVDLENLNQTLQEQFDVTDVELRWIPSNNVDVSDSEQARLLNKLIDTLEAIDDVQNVTANFDMSDDLIAASLS